MNPQAGAVLALGHQRNQILFARQQHSACCLLVPGSWCKDTMSMMRSIPENTDISHDVPRTCPIRTDQVLPSTC